jgi:hypothetical protein
MEGTRLKIKFYLFDILLLEDRHVNNFRNRVTQLQLRLMLSFACCHNFHEIPIKRMFIHIYKNGFNGASIFVIAILPCPGYGACAIKAIA